jgi:hypothetical protein
MRLILDLENRDCIVLQSVAIKQCGEQGCSVDNALSADRRLSLKKDLVEKRLLCAQCNAK